MRRTLRSDHEKNVVLSIYRYLQNSVTDNDGDDASFPVYFYFIYLFVHYGTKNFKEIDINI